MNSIEKTVAIVENARKKVNFIKQCTTWIMKEDEWLDADSESQRERQNEINSFQIS